MSRPDVTFLLPALSGGGVERVFANLAGGLAARGLAVDLLLLNDPQPRQVTVPDGVNAIDLRAPTRSDATFLLALPKLVRYLREARPRAIYAGITTINLLALWAKERAGVDTRVILSEHVPVSVNARTHPLKRPLPALVRRNYPRADAVVAVSQDLAADLRSSCALPSELVRVVYNPVVSPSLLAGAAAEPDHPWFDGAGPVLLGVGRLVEQKDFDTLLTAFAASRRDDAKLIILGEGQDRPRLEATAASLGLAGRVALPGHVSKPAAYLGHADLFCLSSIYEGFPTVLIEALACGCPVVSTDCPTGPREILADGEFGELVPVRDAAALGAAIGRALSRSHDRDRLKRRGATFTVEAATEVVLDLLAEIGAR